MHEELSDNVPVQCEDCGYEFELHWLDWQFANNRIYCSLCENNNAKSETKE